MNISDQLDRKIELNKTPKRIVSLVPSLTELVCDLGLKSSLVGVTKFCLHPEDIRNKTTVVGGTKNVNFVKIQELKADIILCNKEENTQEMIANLSELAPVHISDINSMEDCFEIISMYGQIFKVQRQAKSIISKIQEEQLQFQLFVANKSNYSVAYFIWNNPCIVVGKETFIDYMLNLNGFTNYFGDKLRYPEIQLKTEYKNVDLVFLSSEPFPFQDKHIKLFQQYFPSAKIILVDGEMFSWYGSRLIHAFTYFKQLHKDKIN